MTNKQKIQDFIDGLRWDTQIESGERFAVVYDDRRMAMPEKSFRKYANALGYSVRGIGADMIITLKGHNTYL
jgi:hypothetical protein